MGQFQILESSDAVGSKSSQVLYRRVFFRMFCDASF
jgi:hypothetical protein